MRFGALGDMVILLSMIQALHRRFGSPIDIVSSGESNRVLLERQPGVGRLYMIRSRKMPYALSFDQWQLTHALRARAFTPTWNCDGDGPTRRLLARAGVPSDYIIDAGAERRYPDEHEVDRWLRLATLTPRACLPTPRACEIASELRVPPLILGEQWQREGDNWLKAQQIDKNRLILIQAGNKRTTKWWRPNERPSNSKHWPEHRWAQVIDELAAMNPDAVFGLCGVRSEYSLNKAILDNVKTARARNFAGELPLPRLLAIQRRAVGMISVDTGPAHSAAALGCPLVVLFGTEAPSRYAPRSALSNAVICLQGHEGDSLSMRGISVNEVITAWMRLTHREISRARIGRHLHLDMRVVAQSASSPR